jgi:glucose/arabinose dehydrogenase
MRLSKPTASLLFLVALSAGAMALASACSGDETGSSESSTGTGTTTGTGTGTGTGGGSTTSTGTGGTGGTGGSGGGMMGTTVDCSPPSGAEAALQLTQIAGGIELPILAKSAPGDPTRLFVVSQQGRIHVIRDGVLLPEPFLDIDSLVPDISGNNERGLLGLAFHPNYAQNGRFFVHFTDTNTSPGDAIIAEFARGASPDQANSTPVAVVLTQVDNESNHNGGSIEFSPVDGFLYIGFGDGGGANDQHGPIGNGQNLDTLLGKMLRIDVTNLPYTIPPGNMTGSGVRPEIWDYGLRNPYRFSFDACNGDLYIGDVGQNEWEEIDVAPAGQGNKNWGWRLMEGLHCFNPQNCDMTGLSMPVVEYSHGQGCSVSGGYVYRGTAIPWLRGTYFYGDFCSGRIWTLRFQNGMAADAVERTMDLESQGLDIAGFGQDYAGEVYVVDRTGGRVFRVDPE